MSEDIARRLVDALYADAPVPAGCRVNHARGLLVEGRFCPDSDARHFCSAPMFAGSDCKLVARFSSSTGNPNVAEDDPHANPRGLAVEIGDDFVLLGHSVEAFPARSPEEFLAFIEALAARDTAPDTLERHFREHPAAPRFEGLRTGSPSSFAALRYHMLHAYCLSGPQRTVTGRLSIAGFVDAPGRHEPIGGANYLGDELRTRLEHGSVELLLAFTPAGHDNPTDDVSTPWPDRSGTITLGRLVIERAAADQTAQRTKVFDPSRVPSGVKFAGDPMIDARVAAYQIAAARRLTPFVPG